MLNSGLAGSTTPNRRNDLGATFFVLGFTVISLVYFYSACQLAKTRLPWMDEFPSVIVAQQTTIAAKWAAVWNGVDLSPPTYHIFLHAFAKVAGHQDSWLMWRIPSILAIYGAAVCVCLLVRRYLHESVALLALALALDSDLMVYATQVRHYAFLALWTALALFLWDSYAATRYRRACSVALWFVAALSLCFHFYGFVCAAAVGVAEVLWLLSRRHFRWGIWLPLVLTLPVECAWLPLALHLGKVNAGDNTGPAYFARPKLDGYFDVSKEYLLGGYIGSKMMLVFLGFMAVLAIVRVWLPDRTSVRSGDVPPEAGFSLKTPLEMILVALGVLPLIVFLWAKFITGSYHMRYTIPSALFFSVAAAYVLNKFSSRRLAAMILLVLVVLNLGRQAQHNYDAVADNRAALTEHEAVLVSLPLVVQNGRNYIEMMGAVNGPLRKSLIFLLRPPDFKSPDPINENQLKRMLPLEPDYQVQDTEAFLATHSEFNMMFTSEESMDQFTPWLMTDQWKRELISDDHGVTLLHLTRNASSAAASAP